MTPIQGRHIPVCDLGNEYLSLRPEIDRAVERVLKSGTYVLGPEAKQFEAALTTYTGARFAIGVNSGTDAILIALRALNVGPGDEVVVPAMTFFASAEPVALLGAKPVFVDIDPRVYALDVMEVEQKISAKTKAVIAVHLYGHPVDLEPLLKVTRSKNVPLIEDMAQAIGAEYAGKRVGSWGTIACLSFFPTKNLGACGDAGAVLTSDKALAERVETLRNHGAKTKYQHDEVAYNSRLDELQAAILSVKLNALDGWNEQRRALAKTYSQALAGLPITLPTEAPGAKHIYHLYCICSDRRDALRTFLDQRGISTGLHYPKPLHLQQAFASLGHKVGEFPNSERLAAQTLSLPLYPQMTHEDASYVAETVREFFKS